MGYAIAAAAAARGAEVVLVTGPSGVAPPYGPAVVGVTTALEMREAMLAAARDAAVVVMTAAVADHRPKEEAALKLEHKNRPYSLEMVPNPDILRELVERRPPGQLIVGFAAETHDLAERARAKRERKGCDLLVANDVTQEGAGFDEDTNAVTLIDAAGRAEPWPTLSKRAVAERLLDAVAALRRRG
jgi:phosphopantothenoylcysteine decarboxylase/phosphopantothenate--cysteine ligase